MYCILSYQYFFPSIITIGPANELFDNPAGWINGTYQKDKITSVLELAGRSRIAREPDYRYNDNLFQRVSGRIAGETGLMENCLTGLD